MVDPKTSAEVGYRTFLASQYDAIAAITELGDETYAWCFMIAVRAGLPQQTLADKIDVTQPTVSRWSRGDNPPKNQLVRQAYVTELMSCFADFIFSIGGIRPKPVVFAFRPVPKGRGEHAHSAKTF